MRYAVYIRICTCFTSKETQDLIIMNVEAHTHMSAEHRLLDKFRTVTNALAFDMETEAEMMLPYLIRSKVFDIADFERRNSRREAAIQSMIDEQLEMIDEINAENDAHRREIARLQCQIETLSNEIEYNNEHLDDLRGELDDFCTFFNMPNVHSDDTVVGIA